MISLFIAFEVWCLPQITGMALFTFNKTFTLFLTTDYRDSTKGG